MRGQYDYRISMVSARRTKDRRWGILDGLIRYRSKTGIHAYQQIIDGREQWLTVAS